MPPDYKGITPACWSAFRAGEEWAFDEVFRMYLAPLSYYAFTIVQEEKLAEDIVQDCFVELWERRKKLEGIESVNSYLYRCVHNRAVRTLKKSARAKVLPDMPLQEEPVENNIIAAEIVRHILLLMDHLPERMKQVVQLYYLEEKSYTEIGQVIGIDPETARSHRYRAIQLLRKTIIPG